jgi:hypothetical protein
MTDGEARERVQAAERQRDQALAIACEALRELTDDQLLAVRKRLDEGEADGSEGAGPSGPQRRQPG